MDVLWKKNLFSSWWGWRQQNLGENVEGDGFGTCYKEIFLARAPNMVWALEKKEGEFLVSGSYPYVVPLNIPGMVGVGTMGERYVSIIRIQKERRGLTRVTLNCPFLTLYPF